jgi:hypothetical protein
VSFGSSAAFTVLGLAGCYYNSIFCDVPSPHDPANGCLVSDLFAWLL